MQLIKFTSLQRARIILWFNASILFLFIIFTPYLIKMGIWGVPEWVIETVFLAVEIFVLIRLFRNYDLHSRRTENRVDELSLKLKQQEKTLMDSLEYLGKINVQMSIMKRMINKMRPSADNEGKLEYVLQEVLSGLSNSLQTAKVFLRIVNVDTGKTMQEIELNQKESKKFRKECKLTNDALLDTEKELKMSNKKIHIVKSDYDSFSIRTFLIFSGSRPDKTVEELIQGMVNQCEIIFLLANSRYYRLR